ncbi:MAG: alcohol dehydrogenase catalytic domain-containing protein [Candidatus Lokiarchaeota archaeon]|nr:alcohol dehydrogenase catalytic domain-containing protein [Candidatus Lokiarchaeota archaeon]
MVKVHYCGICGSDITNFKHKMYNFPLVMGHEITGIVEELGEDITDVKVGDKVICVNVSLDVSQGQLKGMGMFQDGGFAEYVKVPKISIFPIPENISIKDAVMVETFALMMRAFKLSRIEKNENILIIGGGNVGLTALKALLLEKNPNYIVIVEPNEFLRKKAIEMGATDAVGTSRAKVKKVIKKLGAPSFIFDCVGNEETISNAINFIKKGGTILLEGIHKGSITFPLFMLNSKEVTLKGCLGHDREDILAAIDLFAKNKVDSNEFISEMIHLEDMQKTFERYIDPNERNFVKIIVQP